MVWKNKRPLYCDQDQIAHKKMLSKYFHCSNVELLLFEKLCAMWSDEIYYNVFLHHVSRASYGIEKILLIFLRKLEHAGYAVIRTVCDERNRYIPDSIVLADRDSPFIAQSIIEEQYHRMNHNPKRSYVTEDTLKVPDHVKQRHIKPVSLVDLHEMRTGHFPTDTKLYRITLHGLPIIFCFSAFNDFYSSTEKKVRNYLQSGHVVNEFKQKNSVLFDSEGVNDSVEKMQYHKLGTLIAYLAQQYARIVGIYPPAERHLLQAVTILHYMNEVQSELSIQLQMRNTRVARDFKTIYNTVRNTSQLIVPKEEYHELIKSYRNSWNDSFEENIIKLCTNSPAHPLLITDYAVIHKEHLEDYFRNNYVVIQEKIQRLLVEDMYKHIKIGDLMVSAHYSNISNIENHLLGMLKSADPISHHLVKNPHHYTSVAEKNRYNTVLAFNINLDQSFFRAFRKLSFLRRILYRFSSECNDLQNHFHFLSSIVEKTRKQEFEETEAVKVPHDESNWQNAFQLLLPSHDDTSA